MFTSIFIKIFIKQIYWDTNHIMQKLYNSGFVCFLAYAQGATFVQLSPLFNLKDFHYCKNKLLISTYFPFFPSLSS